MPAQKGLERTAPVAQQHQVTPALSKYLLPRRGKEAKAGILGAPGAWCRRGSAPNIALEKIEPNSGLERDLLMKAPIGSVQAQEPIVQIDEGCIFVVAFRI